MPVLVEVLIVKPLTQPLMPLSYSEILKAEDGGGQFRRNVVSLCLSVDRGPSNL